MGTVLVLKGSGDVKYCTAGPTKKKKRGKKKRAPSRRPWMLFRKKRCAGKDETPACMHACMHGFVLRLGCSPDAPASTSRYIKCTETRRCGRGFAVRQTQRPRTNPRRLQCNDRYYGILRSKDRPHGLHGRWRGQYAIPRWNA